jgi:hypothetical protein
MNKSHDDKPCDEKQKFDQKIFPHGEPPFLGDQPDCAGRAQVGNRQVTEGLL